MSTELAAFTPENIPQAMELAKVLSTSGLMPAALRGKPADILIVLMTGRELGLGPMQSVRGINVIDGKAVMGADLMMALAVKKREVCEYFRLTESTAQRAVFVTKRVGSEPVTLSFTLEQAARANLLGKNNWKNYQEAMLRARAASGLARTVYPDLFLGVYDPDELGRDAPPAEREVNGAPKSSPVEELKGQVRAHLESTKAARMTILDVTPAAEEPPPHNDNDFRLEPTPPDAPEPAEDVAPAEPVDPPMGYGSGKGRPLAELDKKSLAWYAKTLAENLANPDKARFHEKTQIQLESIQREQKRRS